MNKEEMLNRLRALEESLPKELSDNANANRLSTNAQEYFQNYYEKLENARAMAGEYDEEAVEKENDQKENIIDEMTELKTELVLSIRYRDGVLDEIAELEDKIERMPRRIAYKEDVLRKYDERLKKVDLINNPTEMRRILWEKDKALKERDEFVARFQQLKERLENRKVRLSEVSELIDKKNSSISEFESEVGKINDRIADIKNKNKVSDSQMEKLENDAEAMYQMSKYFNANPKSELNRIIVDYEAGRMTEQEVNERLQNIKSMLTSDIYDVKKVETALSPQQLETKRKEINNSINALTGKLEDSSLYLDRSPIYDETMDQLTAYKTIIDKVKEEQAALSLRKDERISEIKDNELRIAKYDKWVERGKRNISIAQASSELTEEEKEQLISAIDEKVQSYEASSALLKKRNSRLSSKNEEFDKEIEIRNARIARYEEKSENLRSKLFVVNESERQKDEKELENLEALLMSTYLETDTFKNSFEKGLDKLIDLTGGKTLKEENDKILPSFTKNFTPEQRKIYDDILSKLDNSEKEELESELQKKVDSDDLSLANEYGYTGPVQEGNEMQAKPDDEGFVLVDKPEVSKEEPVKVTEAPKVKVNKFTEAPKSKLDEIKAWFKKNWKKVVAMGLVIAALGSAMCGRVKSKDEKVPISTVTFNMVKPIETVTFDIVEDEIPEADIPVFEEDDKKEVKEDDITPSTPETPDPGVKPDPTPEEDEKVTSYVLDTNPHPETGNSKPADEEEAYLSGDAMYNPTTNTWIDSEGTKITGNPDGTFEVEHNAEEVNPINDSQVELENPDFTPLEQSEQTVPEEATTIEEAVKNRTLTPEEAAQAQDFFDQMFSEIYEEESKGLGK